MDFTLNDIIRRLLGFPVKDPRKPVRVRAIRDPDTDAVLGWYWSCDNNGDHRYGAPESAIAPTGERAIAGAVAHVALHARMDQLRADFDLARAKTVPRSD